MGVERFGVLSLAWIVVGYFSLFDLGIGRALTKLVADKLGSGEQSSIPPLVWTSLLLMFLLGVFGAVVALACCPLAVHRLKISGALQTETLRGFYLLALSIPIVTTTAGLRGVLEALQRFRMANLIRIPLSVFTFVGPVMVLPFSHSLVPVVGSLIAGRFVGCIVQFLACFYALPALRHNFSFRADLLLPTIKLGGWMTVSNIVGPLMTYLDRFLIGSVLSVAAVAFYTVPFDLTTRLLVIPGAIAGVLFPAFAVSRAENGGSTELIFSRGVKYTFLTVFPLVLVIAALAPEGLRLWLGSAFSENGSSVLRWLAIGTLLNCIAFIPFALVQGAGRPDLTAKLHLAELPVYLAALYVLVRLYGIEGAAIAWTGRVAVDAAALFLFANRLLVRQSRFLYQLGAVCLLAVAVLGIESVTQKLPMRLLTALAVLVMTAVVTWRWLLAPGEKNFLNLSRRDARASEPALGVSSVGRTDVG
jgi:O-antigen/teichoic acid export membrane protein